MNDMITVILICTGVLFNIFGCIGLIRLPDVYNRLQSATKCVTLGCCSILLGALIHFAETSKCRRIDLLRYFGEDATQPCGNCDNCLNPPLLKDARVAAQMLLSAVQRTGQMFGLGHLVDVLRGSGAEKIRKFGHDELTVFGIGKDFEKPEWDALARQLLAADALGMPQYAPPLPRDRAAELPIPELNTSKGATTKAA